MNFFLYDKVSHTHKIFFFFQGTTFPALNALLARWAPVSERGRMGSLVFGGAQIGNIAGTYLSGLVMKETGEWQSVFYLFGAIGILWFILWVRTKYNFVY